jgi:ABC-type hemin transport system substrate-binding protein
MSSRGVSYLQRMLALGFVTALLWLLFAPNSPIVASDARSRAELEALRSSEAIPRPRLAATSPAMTDTLVELGLAAHIVGRSPYCRSVPKAIPVVGDLRDFDAERLRIARPEFLFVQPPLAGVDPALAEFCQDSGIELVVQRIDSFEEMRAFVRSVTEAVTGVQGDSVEGKLDRDALAARFSAAERDLSALVSSSGAEARETMPKVLLLVSSEPFLAVGRANYLDEMLASVALGNALDREGWVELSAESILALAPSVVVGVCETKDGASRLADAVRALPWNAGGGTRTTPKVAARALPELLSPSLVAARRRGALRELFDEAIAAQGGQPREATRDPMDSVDSMDSADSASPAAGGGA